MSERRLRVAVPSNHRWVHDQFRDVVDGLTWGLEQLDLHAGGDQPAARAIVLCPHLIAEAALPQLPSDAILYNLEQITPASQLPPSRLWRHRHWTIWDFSPRNIGRWADLGIGAAHLPIGWHPGLERVTAAERQDIDVLFLGIANHRRLAALERMRQSGLAVAAPVGVFGAERDGLIARAKVIVNIHYYPTSLLETLRLMYLLANRCAVVSERAVNSEIPPEYEGVVRWAPFERLAEACRELVADNGERSALAAAGQAAMRRLPTSRLIEAVLADAGAGNRS